MSPHLQSISDFIKNSTGLNEQEKESLLKSIKEADKTQALLQFKLERIEKDRFTLSVMLEESIEDLQKKSRVIEEANKARDESAKEAETFATKTIAEIQEDLKDLITKLGD